MDQALMVRPTLPFAVGDAPVRPRKNSEIIQAKKKLFTPRKCDGSAVRSSTEGHKLGQVCSERSLTARNRPYQS